MLPNSRPRSVWQVNLLSLGLVSFASFLTSLTQGGDRERDAQNPTAVSLMKQAHDGRATWRNFLGFRADLRATFDGISAEGKLLVSPVGEVKLELPDAEHFTWVNSSLRSVVSHRLSDDDAIESVAFADDQENHPLGRLLKSTGEGDKSLWRVQGDVMTEVHRRNDKTHFTISVTDVVRNAEGKHLPRNFSVTTWDSASGQIKTNRQVYNEWKRVGRIDLPVKLLAAISKDDGSRRVEQIELSNFEMLSVPANKSASR